MAMFHAFQLPGLWAVIPTALVLLSAQSLASTSDSRGQGGGEGSTQFTGLNASVTANLFSGAMDLSIPILVPPGRPHATPSVSGHFRPFFRSPAAVG